MAVKFPTPPGASAATRPLRFEASIYDCEVEGNLPKELNGTFYRACLDRRYPSRFPNDALFNEDGAADMFRFNNGSVDYVSRYIHTERFIAERKARKALFGLYRNKYTSDPSVQGLSHNTANTQPVFHAGKLFFLKESNLPMQMHPHTLATMGEYDFGGQLKSQTFTAHPKIDTRSGEMIAFGYEAKGDVTDDIVILWIDRNGKITRDLWFKVPAISMMHDMAITDSHIIIPTTGYRTSMDRLKAGKVHWAHDRAAPTYVAVIPRDAQDAKEVRWFEGPGEQMMHTVNAISDGNKILLDAPVSPSNPYPWIENLDGTPFDPKAGFMTIRRWEFDLGGNSKTWKETNLFPRHGSSSGLSRMDDRFVGQEFRYSFMGYNDTSKPFDSARGGDMAGRVNNSYGRYDHDSGKVDSFFVGDTHSLQENCFVPRSQSAAEGDGYLIGVATDFAELRSELVVVDTQAMAEGAVARVKLPFRIHAQVHGWWVPASQLALESIS